MTVRLLQPYNGNINGATVDYDNATEASLVAQGLAIYAVNPGSLYQPLTAKEQQDLRNILAFQTSEDGKKRHSLWQSSMLLTEQTTFGGRTWRQQTTLGAPGYSHRVGFSKLSISTWTVDALAFGTSSVFGNPDAVTWYDGTFGNGTLSAITVPQWTKPIGYLSATAGDFIYSDWCNCPTIARTDGLSNDHLLLVSAYSASTNTPTVNNTGSTTPWRTQPVPFATWFKVGDNTKATGFGTTDPGSVPFLCIETRTKSAGISVGVFGDSIAAGLKSGLVGKGWILGVRDSLNAVLGGGVSALMSAISGDKPTQYLRRMQMMLAAGGTLPDIVFFCPYSRNEGGTVESCLSNADAFIQIAKSAGATPVLVNGIPETAAPSNNGLMFQVNAQIPALAASYGIPYVPMDTVVTLANAATTLDVDGIHPNPATNDAMGGVATAVALPLARSLLGII